MEVVHRTKLHEAGGMVVRRWQALGWAALLGWAVFCSLVVGGDTYQRGTLDADWPLMILVLGVIVLFATLGTGVCSLTQRVSWSSSATYGAMFAVIPAVLVGGFALGYGHAIGALLWFVGVTAIGFMQGLICFLVLQRQAILAK